VSTGLPAGGATAVGASGIYLYAGTDGAGLFYSTNQGTTWQPTTGTVSQFYGYISRVLPYGSDILVALRGGGIYRSPDNGTTWSASNTGLTNRTVYDVLKLGSDLYVSTLTGGVYRSTDGGNNWSAYGAATIGELFCYQLAYDGTYIYVGTNSKGVYRSVPASGTWTACNTGQPFFSSYYQQVFGVGYDGTNMHTGLDDEGDYYSSNNGNNWSLSPGSIGILDVMCYYKLGTDFFAGTKYGGVHKLTSVGGTTWAGANTGLGNGADSISGFDSDGSYLYVAADSGVYRTANQGSSWQGITSGLDVTASINCSFASGGYTYLGFNTKGVYRSNDGGQTWQARNNGVSGNVYGFASYGGRMYVGSNTGEIYYTTDGGANYTQVKTATAGNVAYASSFAFVDSTHFYANSFGVGVFTSSDGGDTWSQMTSSGLGNLNVNVLVSSGTMLLAGTDSGIYSYNTAAGGSWIAVSTSGMSNLFVHAILVKGSTVFAGTRGGLYTSTNAMSSWSPVGGTLPSLGWFNTLLDDGTELLAGTYGAGMFYSTNSGASWTAYSAGLTNKQLTSLSVNGNTVFATTNGAGAWAVSTPATAPVHLSVLHMD
jgi:hypothetical protein